MFHPDNVSEPKDTALKEAIRLWESELRSPIPANISAGFLIHMILSSNSQDRLGRPYIDQAMHLALQSGLFTPSHADQMYDRSQPEQTRQRGEFAWAVYAHHGCVPANSTSLD
jgi:hypothetical protein